MRIIAGLKRGMKLFSPPGSSTRPITDRVKESLFSILYNHGLPEDAVVADLFCGTGSMGLESLSRGAAWVTFIDKDRRVIEILRKNIDRAVFGSRCRAISANILTVGAVPIPEHGPYDLVFVDPPYVMSSNSDAGTRVARLMELIDGQVNPGALVILRTHEDAFTCDQYGQLAEVDVRNWGAMKLVFYRKPDDNTGGDKKMTEKKMVIGILGGIASGKTTVARCFEPLGCAVIEADKLAHEILQEPDTKEQIISLFGDGVIDADGRVNRKSLAKVAFADYHALKRLDELVQPKVMDQVGTLIDHYQQDGAVKAIVLDAPLLAEVDRLDCCDVLVFVEASEQIRLERLKKSGKFDENELKKRENFQISLDKKRKIAHYVVRNNSDLSDVAEQVAQLFSTLTSNR